MVEMNGDETKDTGGAVPREEREEQGNGVERKRRDRDAFERPRGAERRQRGREEGESEWRLEGDRREQRRGQQHRGEVRNRESRGRGSRELGYDSLLSTDRKKKRIEEKDRQASTIFVGDLDPETTAEQLSELFKKFGSVMTSKIKENHCYGFVTFDKKGAAETAIAASQNPDGIESLNGKQVGIVLMYCGDVVFQIFLSVVCTAMWCFDVAFFSSPSLASPGFTDWGLEQSTYLQQILS